MERIIATLAPVPFSSQLTSVAGKSTSCIHHKPVGNAVTHYTCHVLLLKPCPPKLRLILSSEATCPLILPIRVILTPSTKRFANQSPAGSWTILAASWSARIPGHSWHIESNVELAKICAVWELNTKITYSWSIRAISDCPNASAPNVAMSAAPVDPLLVCQRAAATTSVTCIGSTSATRGARSTKRTQAPKPALFLRSFTPPHALLLDFDTGTEASGRASHHAGVAAESCRFSTQAANLAVPVHLSLLHLLLR